MSVKSIEDLRKAKAEADRNLEAAIKQHSETALAGIVNQMLEFDLSPEAVEKAYRKASKGKGAGTSKVAPAGAKIIWEGDGHQHWDGRQYKGRQPKVLTAMSKQTALTFAKNSDGTNWVNGYPHWGTGKASAKKAVTKKSATK